MSNAAFIVAPQSQEPQIWAWLLGHGSVPGAEARRYDLTTGHSLFIISHEVGRSVDEGRRCFFRGTAVDYGSASVVFGMEGARRCWGGAPVSALEGEYVTADWSAGGLVRLSRDLFANVPLLYSRCGEVVIASDSILLVADLRAHLGHPNTPDVVGLTSRAPGGTLFGQQVSMRTFVEEITFLPTGHDLVMDCGRDCVTVSVTSAPLPVVFEHDGDDYGATLSRCADNVARLVAGLCQVPGLSPKLNLSGGLDSRVVLAGTVAAGVTDQYRFFTQRTNAVNQPDFVAASALASHLDISLKPQALPPGPTRQDVDWAVLTLWGASGLGLYDYLIPRRRAKDPEPVIPTLGMGAETVKGNYGWRHPTAVLDGLPGAIADAVREELTSGIGALGVPSDDADALEWHYVGYRNGLHGGRHVANHMTGVSPLQQRELVGLVHSDRNEHPRPGKGEPSVITDLLIALSPELALMPFDDPKKNLDAAFVQARAGRLSESPRSERTPFEVYGHPWDVPDGPTRLSIDIARCRGMSGPSETVGLLSLSRDALDAVPAGPLRDQYASLHKASAFRLQTQKVPLGTVAGIGKLLAVRALLG